MADGKGCKCAAHGSNECGCGVDWTPQEVYDLKERVRELEAELTSWRKAFPFTPSPLVAADALNICDRKLSEAKKEIERLETEKTGGHFVNLKWACHVCGQWFDDVVERVRHLETHKNDREEISRLKKEVEGLINGERDLELEEIQQEARDQEMDELKKQLEASQREVERFSSRDGNAKIKLCFDDGNNPFAREDLKVVDFGVSDNVYVVESSKKGLTEETVFQIILKFKYPNGFPFLPNHNSSMQEVYPELFVKAQEIHAAMKGRGEK